MRDCMSANGIISSTKSGSTVRIYLAMYRHLWFYGETYFSLLLSRKQIHLRRDTFLSIFVWLLMLLCRALADLFSSIAS